MNKVLFVALAACNFSMHSGLSTSGSSSSTPDPEPAPSPAATVATASAPATAEPAKKSPSKRGNREPRPGEPAPVFGAPEVTVTTPLAAADWNGVYEPDAGACRGERGFDPNGPDVQTLRDTSSTPGFKCPGSCINPSKATLAKGKMSFPLIWVDDDPPETEAGKYTITLHRYKLEVPVGKTDDKTIVNGKVTMTSPAFKWSHNNIYKMLSDALSVVVGVGKTADVHSGTGRFAMVQLALRDPAPNDPKYQWLDDAEAGCTVTLYRSDWKAGDGLSDDDGGDEETSSSSSSSHDSGDHGSAKRACKSSCRSAAGSCRTSCHGQSAKCASSCNHDESACEHSCG